MAYTKDVRIVFDRKCWQGICFKTFALDHTFETELEIALSVVNSNASCLKSCKISMVLSTVIFVQWGFHPK